MSGIRSGCSSGWRDKHWSVPNSSGPIISYWQCWTWTATARTVGSVADESEFMVLILSTHEAAVVEGERGWSSLVLFTMAQLTPPPPQHSLIKLWLAFCFCSVIGQGSIGYHVNTSDNIMADKPRVKAFQAHQVQFRATFKWTDKQLL